jgi:hypothetical protein
MSPADCGYIYLVMQMHPGPGRPVRSAADDAHWHNHPRAPMPMRTRRTLHLTMIPYCKNSRADLSSQEPVLSRISYLQLGSVIYSSNRARTNSNERKNERKLRNYKNPRDIQYAFPFPCSCAVRLADLPATICVHRRRHHAVTVLHHREPRA